MERLWGLRASNNANSRHRFVAAIATLALVAGIAAPAIRAQSLVFRPEISIGAQYFDNLELLDEEGASDSAARVSVVLPLTRTYKNDGVLSFIYNPVIERYQDADVLDNTEHLLSLGLELKPKANDSLQFRSRYERSQNQFVNIDNDPDLFQDNQTERETRAIQVIYVKRWSGGWQTEISGGYEERSFDSIEGVDDNDQLEDRSEVRGDWAFTRSFSARSNIGTFVGLRRFDLDVSGEETVLSAGLIWNQRLSQRNDFDLRIGGFRSEGAAAGGLEGTSDDERTGVLFQLGFERRYALASLRIDAARAPSIGGAIRGTSTDSSIGLTIEKPFKQKVGWQLFTRFTERDPTEREEDTTTSIQYGGLIEFRLTSRTSLRLDARQITSERQASDDLELFRAGLEWVWYPFEGTRIGGRR